MIKVTKVDLVKRMKNSKKRLEKIENCLHQNTTAKETKNGCFKIKCRDCGKSWTE
jgi:hypothetical protein